MHRRVGLLAVLALAACGGDQASDDDGSAVDAPAVSDGNLTDAIGCIATVDFEPDAPLAGEMVEAYGDVPGGVGVIDYMWTVKRNGVDVPWVRIEGNERGIKFLAVDPGIYDVMLEVGAGCQPFFGGLNVQAPGANDVPYRLRFVPPASLGAPPQEETVFVHGGGDITLENIGLDRGLELPISVRSGGAPVAAYLRFISRQSAGVFVEAFSDITGETSVRVAGGNFDVLIVPTSAALAPRLVENWDPLLRNLTVDGGQVLSGRVLDAAGAPLAGAAVSVVSAGVPSTIGTTASDGTFSLRWREGGAPEELTVVPAIGSDLPRLDATVEITGIADLVVRHAAVTSSDLGGTLVEVGGTAAASTAVLFDVTLADSGTVRDGTAVIASATGSHRRSVTTDATGHLPPLRFVDGTGAAFIASAGPGAYAALALPLGGPLSAPAPVTISGQVEHSADFGGGGVMLAGVRATLTGPLASPGVPMPAVTATMQGNFSLQLAGGAPYALTFSDPSAGDAGLTVALPAASTQVLSALVLPAAVAIRGTVRITGTSTFAKSVGVAALCAGECEGVERSRPLAEAVTDVTGTFVLSVPDPGVTQ